MSKAEAFKRLMDAIDPHIIDQYLIYEVMWQFDVKCFHSSFYFKDATIVMVMEENIEKETFEIIEKKIFDIVVICNMCSRSFKTYTFEDILEIDFQTLLESGYYVEFDFNINDLIHYFWDPRL